MNKSNTGESLTNADSKTTNICKIIFYQIDGQSGQRQRNKMLTHEWFFFHFTTTIFMIQSLYLISWIDIRFLYRGDNRLDDRTLLTSLLLRKLVNLYPRCTLPVCSLHFSLFFISHTQLITIDIIKTSLSYTRKAKIVKSL